MLTPVNGTRLSHEVQRQLQQLIIEKRLGVGDRLPGERELGSIFNVSRTVVREALRAMESMGWVEVRQGKGTVVKGITPPAKGYGNRLIQDPKLFRELMEVRCLLEVKAAALAAGSRSADDLAELAQLLDEMAQAVEDGEWRKFALLDVEFHHIIVRAANNRVLKEMMANVSAPLLASRHATVVGLPERAQKVHRFHQRIYEAIKIQDADTSGTMMKDHLDKAASDFEAALSHYEEGGDELQLHADPEIDH